MKFSSYDKLTSLKLKFARTLNCPKVEKLLLDATNCLPATTQLTKLDGPVIALRRIEPELLEAVGAKAIMQFAALLVIELAIKRAVQLDRLRLTHGLFVEIDASFDRLISFIDNLPADYWIGNDFFLKDLRVFGGYSIPCGAQDVDILSSFNRRGALKTWALDFDFPLGCKILQLGGPRWLRIHTDPRFTTQFNEEGWEACYLRIADVLQMYPTAKGMVGTSWFYDPQLLTVSPRLGYLQTTPIKNGAFLIKNGPGSIHTDRATSTSPTRRSLFEAGKYMPLCYTIVWQRERILKWAEGQTTK